MEHTFGILKARWRILGAAHKRSQSEIDHDRTWMIVRACLVLHNLVISTATSVISDEELQAAMADEYTISGDSRDIHGIGPAEERVRHTQETHLVRDMVVSWTIKDQDLPESLQRSMLFD